MEYAMINLAERESRKGTNQTQQQHKEGQRTKHESDLELKNTAIASSLKKLCDKSTSTHLKHTERRENYVLAFRFAI